MNAVRPIQIISQIIAMIIVAPVTKAPALENSVAEILTPRSFACSTMMIPARLLTCSPKLYQS